MKRTQLQALAQNSIKTFHGTVSDFIIPTKSTLLSGLSTEASAEFTNKLFASLQKQGFFSLKDGTIVLYNILEQKLLQNGTNINEEGVTKLKGDVLNQKLLKALESKYPIQIFMEGI
jgi:peptidyl-prolyl cis-trans isomerase D